MNEAAEAESKRYLEALKVLIIAYADGKLTRPQFIKAWERETDRHHSAMYAIGGGVESS